MRGVESPWERIRLFRQRATRTPLVMALRGTFLVGARPAKDDLVRRFILCAAESGIDIFRLHDPLNDANDLAVPAEAIREAGRTAVRGPRLRRRARRRRLPGRARPPPARAGRRPDHAPRPRRPARARRCGDAGEAPATRPPACPSASTARGRAARPWPSRWRPPAPAPTRSRRLPTRLRSAPTGPAPSCSRRRSRASAATRGSTSTGRGRSRPRSTSTSAPARPCPASRRTSRCSPH